MSEELGLGVRPPSPEDWKESGWGAIVTGPEGAVVALEHQWPEPPESAND